MSAFSQPRAFRLDSASLAAIAREVLARGNRLPLELTGDSMAPHLLDRQRVVLKPADRSDVRIGDVVLCRVGGRLLAHRVVHLGRRGVVVWGDGAAVPDGLASWADVFGVVEGAWLPLRRVRPARSTFVRLFAEARRILRGLVPLGARS